MQEARWRKLKELNQRREQLELQIMKSMSAIEQATLNLSREMIALFSGRLEEVDELPTFNPEG